MVILKNCDLQPGDIIFLVSSSNNLLIRLKRAVQAFTGKDRKHGHMEVVSVFVCTGGDGKKDSFGYQFYNHERQLRLSPKQFIDNLYKQPPEELPALLQSYCGRKELPISTIKKELLLSINPWMQTLSKLLNEGDIPEQVFEKMLQATEKPDELSEKNGLDNEKRRKLIDLLLFCWSVSGHREILPSVNSSLLVFRHTDPKVRDQFLAEYLKQVEVTKTYKAKGKDRTSFWKIFLSLFLSSSQDKYDRDQTLKPSEDTFCAQNVIQVLNKVDPNLVHRGRFVTPKSLEAGMRAATKQHEIQINTQISNKDDEPTLELEDEFEAFIQASENKNPPPPFKLLILPKSGTELIRDLSQAVENELQRMRSAWWKNEKNLAKIRDIEQQLASFKNLQFAKYTISMQVEASLAFLSRTLPILERKTGWFGSWVRATSYSKIRAFARTQGIFDGDLRDYAEQSKKAPSNSPSAVSEEPSHSVVPEKQRTYLFSDWSFSHWSTKKRDTLLQHMTKLLAEGHAIYLWDCKQKQLVAVREQKFLRDIINQEDFDNLWSDRIGPISHKQLLSYAQQQHLEIEKVDFLDVKSCHNIAKKEFLTESVVASAAKFFTPDFSPDSLHKAKLAMLNVEIENAEGEEELVKQLQQIRTQIESEPPPTLAYRSGIDTKAPVAFSTYKKPIFKALDLMTSTPSKRYYRNEVYTNLFINEESSSPFEYFELSGMLGLNDLQPTTYDFHSRSIPENRIKNSKKSTTNTLFLGQCPFTITEDWQALPSLSRGERLLHLAMDGLDESDFEIRYSEKNGLYYIRQSNPQAERKTVSLQLLLQMPKEYTAIPSFNTLAPIPKHEQIHHILMKYYQFGKDKGQLNVGVESGAISNGMSYLEEARRYKVGSCRLRAIGFKEEMSRLYPEIPVVINVNTHHCFIEMKLDGQWQKYCLGGCRNVPTLAENIKRNISASCDSEISSSLCFFAKEKPQKKDCMDTAQKCAVSRYC